MKAVLIVHNAAIDEEVNEMLAEAGASSYTKFANVLGRGKLSEPHLGTEVWPQTNTATMVIADETTAAALMDGVRRMCATLGAEGVKAFAWQIDEAT